jgi:hypothetical protein
MAGVLTIQPFNVTNGTGWSLGKWTNDPPAAGVVWSAGANIPPGGVGRALGGGGQNVNGTGQFDKVDGGVSSVYWGTNVLYVNIGPEIHATSTSTLTQDSFESITISEDAKGQTFTYKTRGGDITPTYSLNSDKSATWSWAQTTPVFVTGLVCDVVFK